MTSRLHPCPSCRCLDDAPPPVIIDRHAPFAELVLELDRITLEEQRAKYRAAIGEREEVG